MTSYKNSSVKLSILITIFIVISLSGCFSEWQGDSAKIIISLGSAGRAAYSSTDTTILNQLEHEIVFTNAGTAEKLEFKASGVTFETYVTSGSWNIKVYSKLNGEYYAIGSEDVVIKLGQNIVKIKMYEALFVTFNAGDGSFKDGKNEVVKVAPKYGKVEPPSPLPTAGDLYLEEWYYIDADEEITFNFENDKIIKSITLYARWGETPPLTGNVSIIGDPYVGKTLNANTSLLGGSGEISYQWTSSSTGIDKYYDIDGATSPSYKLTGADAGNYIKVTVTREGYSNSITSAAVGPVKHQGTFTITFDANGGTEAPPSPITGSTTEKIKLPDAGTFHKEGWTFGGWNTQPNGSGTDYDTETLYNFTDDITLYAKWYVFFNRIDEFSTWLSIQGNNTKENPYNVKLNVSDLGTGGSGTNDTKSSLGLVLQICNEGENKKFVNLDLSGSTFTNIVDGAFLGCIGLTGITIPNTVTSIGQSAFGFCLNLTSVTIPNGVRVIADGAFSPCPSLTSITIPKSVTGIGVRAFYACTSLTVINVDIDNTEYSSQDGVLYNKGKTALIQYPARKMSNTFNIPNSVTGIASGAFTGCTSLTSITIPNNITIIGGSAFSNCTRLASVTLPNNPGFISIQDSTFYECTSLTSVTIPDSVTSIETHAFAWCTSLASITIPNSITSIGERAFAVCISLTSVTFATGSIITGTDFGKNAFPEGANGNGGDNLKTAYQSSTGGGAGIYAREQNGFTWSKIDYFGTSIDDFKTWLSSQTDDTNSVDNPYKVKLNVSSLGSYTVSVGGDDARSILGNVLQTNNGKCVSLDLSGSTFSEINDFAFDACYTLVGITISNSVTTIGNAAFTRCNKLTSVTFATGSSITNFGDNAFPEGADGLGGDNNLRTAFQLSTVGGAGTYTRDLNGTVWTKKT